MDLSIYYNFEIGPLFSDAVTYQPNLYNKEKHQKHIQSLNFPTVSRDIVKEHYNIARMMGICDGFNASYILTQLSENDKNVLTQHYPLKSKDSFSYLGTTFPIDFEAIHKTTINNFNNIIKKMEQEHILSRDIVKKIYYDSIHDHLHPLLSDKFIYPDILIDRHIAYTNIWKSFGRSSLISKSILSPNMSIELYLSDDISNYFLGIRENKKAKLYCIPVNDHATGLFTLLKNEDSKFIKNFLNDACCDLFKDIKKKYVSDKKIPEYIDDITTFTNIINEIDIDWTESLNKIKLVVLDMIYIMWLSDEQKN